MSRPRVILWRHGRTSWNVDYRWQGQSDIELDEVGLVQAEVAAQQLATYQPSLIVASDLKRAHRTAQFLADITGAPLVLDSRLRETDGGQWEGLTQEEIRRDFPEELSIWQRDMTRPAGITGESRPAVAQRVASAIAEHIDGMTEGTVVFATHGGAARDTVAHLLGLPHEHLGAFRVMVNCGWAILDHEPARDAWRVCDYNLSAMPPLDESHL